MVLEQKSRLILAGMKRLCGSYDRYDGRTAGLCYSPVRSSAIECEVSEDLEETKDIDRIAKQSTVVLAPLDLRDAIRWTLPFSPASNAIYNHSPTCALPSSFLSLRVVLFLCPLQGARDRSASSLLSSIFSIY